MTTYYAIRHKTTGELLRRQNRDGQLSDAPCLYTSPTRAKQSRTQRNEVTDPFAWDIVPVTLGMPASGNVRGDWFQTYMGRQFWALDPSPEDISIKDIARALSMMCRYNGHVQFFYSVAQHCCLMVDALRTEGVCDAQTLLWALLHDASEAYIADIVRPVKPFLSNYAALETRIMGAVCAKYGLPPVMPDIVKIADARILADEKKFVASPSDYDWRLVHPPFGFKSINGWTPGEAESRFIAIYRDLTE